MLTCRRCDVAPPKATFSSSSAVRTDFQATVEHLLTKLQHRLVFEHVQVAGEQEGLFQEALASLHQENADLRSRLRLPKKECSSWVRSPRPPTIFSSPGPHDGARQRGGLGCQGSLMVPAVTVPAASRSLMDFPAGDRPICSPRECASPKAAASSAEPVSLPQAITDGEPLRPLACTEEFNTCTSSVMVTVGAQSNVAEYQQFALWPTWTEQHKSFADKISTHVNMKPKNVTFTQDDLAGRNENIAVPCGVLLPSDYLAMAWMCIFCIILTIELTMIPMAVFDMPETSRSTKLVLCIFWTLDIGISMCSAYYTKDGSMIVDRWQVLLHYLKTWAPCDVLTVSADWLAVLSEDSHFVEATGFLRIGKAFRSVRVLRMLRLLRLRKMQVAVRNLDEFINSDYWTIIRSMLVNILCMLMCTHFIGCLWYWIGSHNVAGYGCWVDKYGINKTDWQNQYLFALHWTLTQYTPGSMHIQPQNKGERLFSIVMLLFGMVFFSSIVSTIGNAISTLRSVNSKYRKQLWTLRRYFKEHKVSRDLTLRVVRYAESCIKPKLQRVTHKEVDSEILGLLPQSLYREFMLEIYDDYLQVHPFFAALGNMSKEIMKCLCCTALQEINLSIGDQLFGPGQIAHEMFFVTEGELTYVMEHVGTSEVVKKKRYFCEAVLWCPWVHQGVMCSNMTTELLALDSRKFREVMQHFRAYAWIAQKYGAEYVRSMNELAGFFTADTSDDTKLSDILHLESATRTLGEMLGSTSNSETTTMDT